MRTSNVLQSIIDSCGALGGDEGVLFGDREQEVTGIQVCWMASLDAIQHAGKAGDNLIIAHEDLYFPSWRPQNSTTPVDYLSWRVNQRRIGLLADHGISVIRVHGTLDRHCIFTAFANKLGLGTPAVDEGPYLKAYDLPPDTTFGALVGASSRRWGWKRCGPLLMIRQRLSGEPGCPGAAWASSSTSAICNQF